MTTNPVHAVPAATQLENSGAARSRTEATKASQPQDSVSISAAARSLQSSAASPAASEAASAHRSGSSGDSDHDGS